MAETNELKKIKKMYGENFMKLCRQLFPTILEKEGRLYEILTSTFSANCKTLYDDITSAELEDEFKSYIYSKIDVEDEEMKIVEKKTPYELLDEAGYNLFECKTEKQIQKFRKYYAEGEGLCTFNGGRLNRCVVFFAVKKDVKNINRKNFQNPKREDEYGTSVMGIQFTKKGKCTVSIKNRYNHSVNNPDATYGNDLERITPGLTQSFADLLKERGLNLNSDNIEQFEMPNYVVASDGKYYKYNMEVHGRYYCPDNIIIDDGEIKKIENPEKQILIDYFVLDTEKKQISIYDEILNDSFIDDIKDIENIQVTKNKEKGTRKILIKKSEQEEPIIIEIDKNNSIVGYKNEHLQEVGNNFLLYNRNLEILELEKLQHAGDQFLTTNRNLKKLHTPNLETAGESFLSSCKEENLEITPMKKLHHVNVFNPKWLKEIVQNNKNKINSNEIAKLDKESNLTTSELNGAQKIIQKIKEKFKGWIK